MDKYLKYKKKYLKLKGGMFFDEEDPAYKEPRPLLVQSYSNNLADNQLINSLNLVELMSSYNRPYEMRGTRELEKSGMYYAQDYIDKYFPGKSISAITAVANNKYWDIGVNRVFNQTLISYFQSYDYVKPSDALKSFIKGPTITECANTIQISVYHLIYNLIGEERFDQVFGNLLTPFVVTPTLFEPLTKGERRVYQDTKYEPILGNPLEVLFDIIERPTLESLQDQDILYIKGVREYDWKHISGVSVGWNLIYGRLGSEEPKFIGFGPTKFSEPLTYQGIKRLLIDGYNKEQNIDTKNYIKKNPADLKSTIAKQLENDRKTYDEPIEGVQYIIRFNHAKLHSFITKQRQEWFNESIEDLERQLPSEKKKQINLLTDSFSAETSNASFDNYERLSEQQILMYDKMKKFALKTVTKKPEYGPIGLILGGTPGIGKTHLSVAVANFVSKYNLKVTFTDNDWVVTFSSRAKRLGSSIDFLPSIQDSDLIILDDINSEYGYGSNFLYTAFKYVILNNKSLLFTSNITIKSLQKYLPYIYGYDDVRVKNFLSLNNLNARSYRNYWFVSLGIENINISTNDEKMLILNRYIGEKSAGIVLFELPASINELTYIDKYSQLTGKTDEILIVRDWKQEQYKKKHGEYPVGNFDHKMPGYSGIPSELEISRPTVKIVIMHLFDWTLFDQFLKIVPILHDNKIKIIILSPLNIVQFIQMLKEGFIRIRQSFTGSEIRLKSRVSSMLGLTFE
jgi:DNA replication protein DnaC